MAFQLSPVEQQQIFDPWNNLRVNPIGRNVQGIDQQTIDQVTGKNNDIWGGGYTLQPGGSGYGWYTQQPGGQAPQGVVDGNGFSGGGPYPVGGGMMPWNGGFGYYGGYEPEQPDYSGIQSALELALQAMQGQLDQQRKAWLEESQRRQEELSQLEQQKKKRLLLGSKGRSANVLTTGSGITAQGSPVSRAVLY